MKSHDCHTLIFEVLKALLQYGWHFDNTRRDKVCQRNTKLVASRRLYILYMYIQKRNKA